MKKNVFILSCPIIVLKQILEFCLILMPNSFLPPLNCHLKLEFLCFGRYILLLKISGAREVLYSRYKI